MWPRQVYLRPSGHVVFTELFAGDHRGLGPTEAAPVLTKIAAGSPGQQPIAIAHSSVSCARGLTLCNTGSPYLHISTGNLKVS